jgi:hypothetical protein
MMGSWSLSMGQIDRGVTLTIYNNQTRGKRKSIAILLLPLWARHGLLEGEIYLVIAKGLIKEI